MHCYGSLQRGERTTDLPNRTKGIPIPSARTRDAGPFDRFASYIWSSQISEPDKATFNETAFDAILDIIEIARF
jgi:hypothetical protein